MFFSKADIVNRRAGGLSQANIAPVDNESPDGNTEQDQEA